MGPVNIKKHVNKSCLSSVWYFGTQCTLIQTSKDRAKLCQLTAGCSFMFTTQTLELGV